MDKLGREYTAFVPVRQHCARRAGRAQSIAGQLPISGAAVGPQAETR
ncbi:hypothetical protein [Klebsiella pneumoniae IS10]|nr:hypothetical protein [Klebsiella pneumoniae IS10]